MTIRRNNVIPGVGIFVFALGGYGCDTQLVLSAVTAGDGAGMQETTPCDTHR